MSQNNSEQYEQVTQYIFNELADFFSLIGVEPKQKIPGASGTKWQVDAKGVLPDGGFVIIECRLRKRRVTQSQLGALAYKIQDCGAKWGIIVSPLPLQKGAILVAKHENIQYAEITRISTETRYSMQSKNHIHIKLREVHHPSEYLNHTVSDANGNIS